MPHVESCTIPACRDASGPTGLPACRCYRLSARHPRQGLVLYIRPDRGEIRNLEVVLDEGYGKCARDAGRLDSNHEKGSRGRRHRERAVDIRSVERGECETPLRDQQQNGWEEPLDPLELLTLRLYEPCCAGTPRSGPGVVLVDSTCAATPNQPIVTSAQSRCTSPLSSPGMKPA